MLLRRGELIVNKGFKKFSAHVFLYEDILLFTKTKKPKKTQEFYVYKFSYKVCTEKLDSKYFMKNNLYFFLMLTDIHKSHSK